MFAKFALVALIVLFMGGFCVVFADITWSPSDFPGAVPPLEGSPQGYGFPCEIFDASAVYKDADQKIHITINTNFPSGGLGGKYGGSWWRDSYGVTWDSSVVFDPGDLYVAYAPSGDYWAPEKLFAVGISTHSGNIVPQAYNGSGTWKSVVKGKIYQTANNRLTDFSTGTYEGYESAIAGIAPPDAGNSIAETGLKAQNWETGQPNYNTYPALLRDWGTELGQGTVTWADKDMSRWPGVDPSDLGARDLLIDFDPSLLGLTPDQYKDLHFFWTMECGNDGVLLGGAVGAPVPEPFTVILVGTAALGAVGYNVRRRR
jgi:hypothetical protein